MAPEPVRPRHFSMLRDFHVADFITLGNAACGVAGVFCAMTYVASSEPCYFYVAALLAPVAFVFDMLDGKVARARQEHSILGRELDSLADVISFGVAPAALAFAAGMRGALDWVVLVYFVCCGVSRLARFNVVLVGVLAYAAWSDRIGDDLLGGTWSLGGADLHPLVLLFLVSGSAMISKTLRIPKF
jgi:CDP-diacylglycerol--serine O-phosphatidyltransferase